MKQIHEYSKQNSLHLVSSSKKLIEINKIKPQAKIGLNNFLNFLEVTPIAAPAIVNELYFPVNFFFLNN